MAGSYHFTRPVPRDPAGEYVHDKLFTIDRRHNALDVHTGRISGSHVVQVTDDADQMDDAIRAAGTNLLGPQYGYARFGLIRAAVRPSSHGEGRGRFR